MSTSTPAPVRPQLGTRYTNMLLALDHIPRTYNLLAAFFTWILLAGFVLFPGTFASLGDVQVDALGNTEVRALHAVQNVSLFVIAFICCGIGATGMLWLWWKWMNNFVWIINRLFVPGFLNSLAGIISTITSVYGSQGGRITASSRATIIVTSAAAGVTGILTIVYTVWGVDRVRREHEREVGREHLGLHGEGSLVGHSAQGHSTIVGRDGTERTTGEKREEGSAPMLGIV